jgi:nucleotide-binding universal stress UspA family protein
MFKNILFATSATPACDHAARVAFEMALQNEAHINILHVLGVPTRGYSQEVLDIKTGEKVPLNDDYIEWVVEEIRTYYSKQLEKADDFDITIGVGMPHREILREVKKTDPDLVILGGTTEEGAVSVYKKGMVGSTLHRVAKAAKCPVLAVNRPAASFWGGLSNIVFGTDFSKASDSTFQFVTKLVKALKCELHIFHALDISGINKGKILTQDKIESKIRDCYQLIRGRYIAKLEGFKDYSFDVWEGIPYIEIVKYSREKHADLIVMAGHRQKADSEDSRLGSNIEQVIARAGCPVLSVNQQHKSDR